jgi:hypothetical protein
MENLAHLKNSLIARCLRYAEEKITTSQEAIQGAQASANEETKSSSGDKYETGRAMAQLEIEKQTVQLNEAKKMKQQLEKINFESRSDRVQPGSIVKTDKENYFIAIPAGRLTVDGETFIAISPAAPIAQHLIGLSRSSAFVFNKTEITVLDVF